MNILIEKNGKSYVLNAETLLTESLTNSVFPKEIVEETQETPDIDIEEIKNPILFKDKNVIYKELNDIIVYNVGKSKVSLRYDADNICTKMMEKFKRPNINNLGRLSSYFDEVIETYGRDYPRFFDKAFPRDAYREIFIKFLKKRFEETNYMPQIDMDTGLSLVKNKGSNFWFIDDVTLARLINRANDLSRNGEGLTKDQVSDLARLGSSNVYLNNVYNGSNDICWNSYQTPLKEIVKENKAKYGSSRDSDFSPLMKSTINLFLSSIFNNDLSAESNFNNTIINNIVSRILNFDFSPYFEGTELEQMEEYIVRNSELIYTSLTDARKNMHTAEILLMCTLFKISFSDLY